MLKLLIFFRNPVHYPLFLFSFHGRSSLWRLCNENKPREQTLPQINVIRTFADVLHYFYEGF